MNEQELLRLVLCVVLGGGIGYAAGDLLHRRGMTVRARIALPALCAFLGMCGGMLGYGLLQLLGVSLA